MDSQVSVDVLILLSVSVVVVAVFRWLRLAHVLGYLFVGILIGPYGLGWVDNDQTTQSLGELGVVFLMFAIGLEFSRATLLALRTSVFVLGGLQVALTSGFVMVLARGFGLDFGSSFIAGGVAAMSSTAIVIKQLAEQLELNSRHGRLAVSILLFQDLAVIPFLIVIPAIAATDALHQQVVTGTLLLMLLKGIGISILIILAGYWVLRPLFHVIASQRSNELFMLAVLTVALAAAWITHEAGLSLTLGAFLAGMMLGETEFKHQIESDIRPFQDVFLALFFVSIGMLLDFSDLFEYWQWILGVLAVLLGFKALVIGLVARLMGHGPGVSLRTAIILAHGGEFGFVILSESMRHELLSESLSQIFLSSIVLSMMVTPFLIRYNGWLVRHVLDLFSLQYGGREGSITSQIKASAAGLSDHVVICGYGWTGQGVGRFLEQEGIEFIALDLDPSRVREARNAGENVVYGDPTRGPVIEASGLDRARAMIITHTNTYASLRTLTKARAIREDLPILVRTRDESDLDRLMQAGATEVIADTVEVSMMLASHLFLLLGGDLDTILKRTGYLHQERYRLLTGYYPGQALARAAPLSEDQKVLRTFTIEPHFNAVGRTPLELGLDALNVEVRAIKRHGLRATDPQPEVVFRADDVVVLYGRNSDLKRAEQVLRRRMRRKR
ncbi:MAG: potassium transporter [Gammaproteobacteria bacterium]|nr:MAG: potassium transporter [Gammaproteobacteria bacterium]